MFKPSNVDNTFIEIGFCNWKKILEKLEKHQCCSSHIDSVLQWNSWKQTATTGSVKDQIDKQTVQMIENNRIVLGTLIRICILCGMQNIALRGHRENDISLNNNPGNFKAILNLLKVENQYCNDRISSLPKNANYQSKNAQNDILMAINDVIQDVIIAKMKNAAFYSIIADDTRDISCTEQTSICVRYTLESVVQERFIQFVDVHKLDAISLANVIISVLTQKRAFVTKLCGSML